MKSFFYAILITVTMTAVAFGNPTVNSPSNGATVGSPFTLSTSAATCSSQSVSAMTYSIDNGGDAAIVYAQSMDVQVQAGSGSHVVHVKSWGNKGAGCVTDVAVNVAAGSGNGPSISSPSNGENVGAPFTLVASDSTCKYQPVSAMAYSIDNGGLAASVNGQSLNNQVWAGSGWHTLHVKSWGNQGSSCDTDVAVNVTAGSGGGNQGASIPWNAVSSGNLQTMGNWKQSNDPGAGGWSSGYMTTTNWPSHNGTARQFVTNYSGSGGERYYVSFGDNTTAQNFVYDAWIYIDANSAAPANVEMDMNQTMPNGQTAIFGFQCDGYTGTWDFTKNAGTPQNPVDQWVHTGAGCNPGNWSRNIWHHVQVEYSRDQYGKVTYKTVYFDGNASQIWATVPSAFALGWAPALLTNLQVDGRNSGSINAYLDNVTIYRW